MTKNAVEKKGSREGSARSGNFFKKVGNYFKEVFSETKKLSWPTRKELLNYTVAVIGFVAMMALVIWLLDLAFSNGISALASLKIG